MCEIVKYACDELGGAEISCIVVKGEPWFKGIEVASVLGFKFVSDAVKDHVPLKFKNKLSYLLKASRIGKTPNLELSDLNTNWICEAGLYKLVFKSKLKSAEVFSDWVCSEVLPAIRKTGSYNSKYAYNRDNITNDEVYEFANGREDRLHYDVVKHIETKYPDAVSQAGLGEHLATLHVRIDASNKGYTQGQPDLTIIRRLPNGFSGCVGI